LHMADISQLYLLITLSRLGGNTEMSAIYNFYLLSKLQTQLITTIEQPKKHHC
jgi:hypothetical protein